MEDILDDAEDQSIVVAMDLYGTLVNPASISKALAQALGTGDDKVQQVNTTWRKYQLEYTWRLNSMGMFFTLKSALHRKKEGNSIVAFCHRHLLHVCPSKINTYIPQHRLQQKKFLAKIPQFLFNQSTLIK